MDASYLILQRISYRQSFWMSLLIWRRCSKERSSSHYFLDCCYPSYQHQFIKIDQHCSIATASSPPTQPNNSIILIGTKGVTPCPGPATCFHNCTLLLHLLWHKTSSCWQNRLLSLRGWQKLFLLVTLAHLKRTTRSTRVLWDLLWKKRQGWYIIPQQNII